ncbi:MAG TPA: dipeptide epimerase [Candidatus Limnocylindria bacterium]|jgi:L-alanine-DL-glutamate epimerase-like enolase superfamily enzyme|nr:dipeptide epimerase [Candidatus Limnocylindria bacterium]
MQMRSWRFDLKLRHLWAIATDVQRSGGKTLCPVVFVELTDAHGRRGIGEASPSSQYHETHETVATFLARVDPRKLSFDDIPASVTYLNSLHPGSYPARCAIDLALHDGAAKAAKLPVCDYLGLGFTEGRHSTSFTIGIDNPEAVEAKVVEASPFPILKIKLGTSHDRETLRAVRQAAPKKKLRVDANAAWATPDEALRNIEWLATDGNIEFVEQPMPPTTSPTDQAWLKQRSPLPLIGDESFQNAADAERCANGFHGVNMKLVKTGGMHAGKAALEAARARGLKTMIGCMIESSVLISAGAHLAELTDYLDLDGNVLISNDPYEGVRNTRGVLSFQEVTEAYGLRTRQA